MDYAVGTKGHEGLQGCYSFYSQYKSEQGAMASNEAEWQAMSGTNGMVRLRWYQKRPNGVVRGLSTAMYGVA